jgi:hypothetical protein
VRIKAGDTFTTTTQTASTPSSTGNTSSLSVGAIIGVAFGAFFALVFTAAGIAFFVLKHRRARQRDTSALEESSKDQGPSVYEKAELPAQGPEHSVIQQDLQVNPQSHGLVHELTTTLPERDPVELPVNH